MDQKLGFIRMKGPSQAGMDKSLQLAIRTSKQS